jgi:hypothetical protein
LRLTDEHRYAAKHQASLRSRLADERRCAAKYQASLRPLVVGVWFFDVIDVIDSNDIGQH